MAADLPLESVLVVGGCGFLGQHMVKALLGIDPVPRISVVDLRTDHNRIDGVEYHAADISSKAEIQAVLEKTLPRVIIHTASPSPMMKNLAIHTKVNVEGTRNLIKCAQAIQCVKAFVYTSSASVVHDAYHDLVEADESLPLVFLPEQRELYSHTKALADELVLESNYKASDMLTVSIRPSGIFGPNDVIIKSFMEQAAAGKLKFQMGNGKNLFDYTYVENVVLAHILAAQKLLEEAAFPAQITGDNRVNGEAFLITNDEHMPFWDFARAIGAAAGFPVQKEDVTSIPRGLGLLIAFIAEWGTWVASFGREQSTLNRTGIRYSCMTRTYRIEKAKKRLGYRPVVDLQEAIHRSVAASQTRTKKVA